MPKKRGPKTDVLEALLKRVDGLEQRLKDQKNGDPSSASDAKPPTADDAVLAVEPIAPPLESSPKSPVINAKQESDADNVALFTPAPTR